jgi:hypothetical protein
MRAVFGCDAVFGLSIIQPQGRPKTLTEWEGDLALVERCSIQLQDCLYPELALIPDHDTG